MRQPPAVGHGVAGVDHQVHDHLLDLAGSAVTRPEVGLEHDARARRPRRSAAAAASACRRRSALRSSTAGASDLPAAEGEELAGEGRRRARPPSRISSTSLAHRVAGASSLEQELAVADDRRVSRLLKSWAMPPASRPTASIFWAWRSCSSLRRSASSARLRSVTSWMVPTCAPGPVVVEGQRPQAPHPALLAVGSAADDAVLPVEASRGPPMTVLAEVAAHLVTLLGVDRARPSSSTALAAAGSIPKIRPACPKTSTRPPDVQGVRAERATRCDPTAALRSTSAFGLLARGDISSDAQHLDLAGSGRRRSS